MALDYHVDVLIVGGGIAGLWLLNYLRNQGYRVILLENHQLGGIQTIASQGLIHGGVKYALYGITTSAFYAISKMPALWRACLRGEGSVDLSHARVLEDQAQLCFSSGWLGRIKAFLISHGLHGQVEKLSRQNWPEALIHGGFNGIACTLHEQVVDVHSIISCLQKNYPDDIFQLDWQQASFEVNKDATTITQLSADTPKGALNITAQRYIFAAGEGNAELLAKLKPQENITQLRPLHQVLVQHDYPYKLYAHFVERGIGPKLTVTSLPSKPGQHIWYLGGDLAEYGVNLSEQALVKEAQRELKAWLPDLDLADASWKGWRVNRAEPLMPSGKRPNSAVVSKEHNLANLLLVWPVKLTLAPALAQQVLHQLHLDGVQPTTGVPLAADYLSSPPLAKLFGEQIFS